MNESKAIESQAKTEKNRKYVFTAIVIFAVSISTLLFFISKENKEIRVEDEDLKTFESKEIKINIPTSYTGTNAEKDSIAPTSYPTVDIASFNYHFVNQYKLYSQILENYYRDCGPEDKQFSTKVLTLKDNPDNGLAKYFNYIIQDPETNLGKDEIYDKSYSAIMDLINNEQLDISNRSFNMNTVNIFTRTCSGDSPAIGFFNEIDYPNTDKAFLVMFYGSSQSVVDDSSMFPIYIKIISTKNNNLSVLSIYYLKLWDILIDNHTLSTCKITGNNNYPYIDIFNEPGKSCVENIINTELDQAKVDKIVKEALEIYKIKE